MTGQLFPNSERVRLLWTGVIDRVENGVAYGVASGTVRTFDVPVDEDYGVGTRVEFYSMEWEGSTASHTMVMFRADGVLLVALDETPDGYAIVGKTQCVRGH